ncbi:MAG TPA: hypothetical protein VG992_02690 [Candidatus Saccharimonadales bacterium]|nr:hypothetical protein [Candidatus Saccharimonadales bacterium]
MPQKKYDDNDIVHLGEVIGEHVVSQFKTGLEAIDEILIQTRKIPKMEADIGELKSDMKIVKGALTATNTDIQNHELRITKLEQHPA